MALKDTIRKMEKMLTDLAKDLKKASEKGNKAASQRVRTGTIQFAKLAKQYRKESVAAGRKGGTTKRKKAKKTTRKKATKKRAAPKRTTPKRKVAKKKKVATKRRKRR